MKPSTDDNTEGGDDKLRRPKSFVLQKPQKNDSFGPAKKVRPTASTDLTEATLLSERTAWSGSSANTADERGSRSSSQDSAPELKPSARRPLTEAEARKPTEKAANYSFSIIEDYHAVLGDRLCGISWRSTTATKILKDVKQEFRKRNAGKHGTRWFGAAMDEYHHRVAKHFPDILSGDRGLVLVQCTQQVIDSNRVTEPFSYGYEGKEAIYGPAKVPEAIHFFFKSKDPPVLEKEVHRFRDGLRLMRRNRKERPPSIMMDEFEDLLNFIDKKLTAPKENTMAKELLENIKFIPVLKKLWKTLRQNLQPVPQTPVHDDTSPADINVTAKGDWQSGMSKEDTESSTAMHAKAEAIVTDEFDAKLARLGALFEPGEDDVDVHTGFGIGNGSVLESATEKHELPLINDFDLDDTTNTILENLIHVPVQDPASSKGPNEVIADQSAQQDDGTALPVAPGDAKEVMINSLLKEQVNLKDQISHLQDRLQQLMLNPSSANGSGRNRSEELSHSGRDGQGHDAASFTRCGVERHDSASGRKRGRRVTRKSSSGSRSSRKQRGSSVSSKRSRHHEDSTSVCSQLIPQEIEMPSDSQEEASGEDEVGSYESFDSQDLRGTRTHSGRSNRSTSSHSGHRSLPSRMGSGASNLSPAREIKLSQVSHHRLTDLGESGIYTGTVTADECIPHGKGRFDYDKPGRFYDGEWRFGRWHGTGHQGNGEGDFYYGGFRDNLKHGIGTKDFADGGRFQGRYVLGEMREGTMNYPDGNSYQGEWRFGVPHGHGTSRFADGYRYEGSFRSGLQCGRGIMYWPDGGVYEGEFRDGEVTGHGKELRPDGSVRHQGLFRDGRPVQCPGAERWK